MKHLNTMRRVFINSLMFLFILALTSTIPVYALSIERSDFGSSAIEINFDDVLAGTLVNDLYLLDGVSFDNALVYAGNYPVSPPNLIKSSDGEAITIHFPRCAMRVGIQIDTDGYDPDRQPQMRVFDANGNLLGLENFGQGADFVGFEFQDPFISTVKLGSTFPNIPNTFLYSDAHDNLIFELAPMKKVTVDFDPDIFEVEIEEDKESEEPEDAYLRAFIEPPVGVSVNDIDAYSVTLAVNEIFIATAEYPNIVDNVLDVLFPVNLTNISDILEINVAEFELDLSDHESEVKALNFPQHIVKLIELTISGSFIDGSGFNGSDAVRMILIND